MADTEKTVEVWRIFTRPDGTSSMEPIQVKLGTRGANAVSDFFAGKGVEFVLMPPGRRSDWHTAPRRQMITTIKGQAEVETSDGKVLVMKPGVISLLEDLTGQGHLTRNDGSEDRLSIFMPLDPDTPVA